MSDTNHTSQNQTPQNQTPGLDPALVDLLVCPVTRGPLHYDKATNRLISVQAGLAFPIREGVPVMLEDEAVPVDTAAV